MGKLRILMVLQTPWGTSLGMSKVHYDLKLEYEKLGHYVEYLDWNKLYPNKQSAFNKIFGVFYTDLILKHLKKIASQFDVIDANFNCIPFPKTDYNFTGVVMYRSHGLQPLYRQIEHSAAYKRMESYPTKKVPFKTRIGNLNRYFQQKEGDFELFNSLKYADIVHALNTTEYEYFIDFGIPKNKLVVIPNGVPDKLLELGKRSAISKKPGLVFIGSWTMRKGIRDLNTILEELSKANKVHLSILGGGAPVAQVYPFFDSKFHSVLTVKQHFDQNDLPVLLENSKVGVFPSYAEGFGLAIVEQLALGIPVVAYDAPGPSEILHVLDKTLIIRPGDTIAFAKKVAEIINLPENEYADLVKRCKERAAFFRMSTIAERFLVVYKDILGKLSQRES